MIGSGAGFRGQGVKSAATNPGGLENRELRSNRFRRPMPVMAQRSDPITLDRAHAGGLSHTEIGVLIWCLNLVVGE